MLCYWIYLNRIHQTPVHRYTKSMSLTPVIQSEIHSRFTSATEKKEEKGVSPLDGAELAWGIWGHGPWPFILKKFICFFYYIWTPWKFWNPLLRSGKLMVLTFGIQIFFEKIMLLLWEIYMWSSIFYSFHKVFESPTHASKGLHKQGRETNCAHRGEHTWRHRCGWFGSNELCDWSGPWLLR